MPDTRTISQLEAEGFTGIECHCRNQACRNRIGYPFDLIRKEHPRLGILSAMTLAELAVKMKCSKCGERDFGFKASRQSDAEGFAKSY